MYSSKFDIELSKVERISLFGLWFTVIRLLVSRRLVGELVGGVVVSWWQVCWWQGNGIPQQVACVAVQERGR